jgi:hypothetical protein
VIALWFFGLLFLNLSGARLRTTVSPGGIARSVAGAIFVVAALTLLYASFPEMTQREFSAYAIATFLVALAADFLIGDDIRKRLRFNRRLF